MIAGRESPEPTNIYFSQETEDKENQSQSVNKNLGKEVNNETFDSDDDLFPATPTRPSPVKNKFRQRRSFIENLISEAERPHVAGGPIYPEPPHGLLPAKGLRGRCKADDSEEHIFF